MVLYVGQSSFSWVIPRAMQIQKSASSLSVPPFFPFLRFSHRMVPNCFEFSCISNSSQAYLKLSTGFFLWADSWFTRKWIHSSEICSFLKFGAQTQQLGNAVTMWLKESGFSFSSDQIAFHFASMAISKSMVVPSCFPWLCCLHPTWVPCMPSDSTLGCLQNSFV